ncbi:hypothetical protein ACGFKZ_29510 [Micromonospora tulbaghiae]|uniref:hypothetical protein n=1 Tax=Micromonospora tulbaghiae TaxID=479978 RepID=UPI003723500B
MSAAFALGAGALLGLFCGFIAGRSWERYAYEMAAAMERLAVARGYSGAAARAVALVAIVVALAVGGIAWAGRSDAGPPATSSTPSPASR